MPNPKKEVRRFRAEVVTPEEAYTFLGISRPTFFRLVKDGVIPRAGEGEYILGDVTEAYWRSQFTSEALTAARTRLATAQAELAEMQSAEEQGKLLQSDDVAKAWTAQVGNARTRLLAIPTKVAPELVGQDLPTITDKLKAAVYEALMELADYDPRRIKGTPDIHRE